MSLPPPSSPNNPFDPILTSINTPISQAQLPTTSIPFGKKGAKSSSTWQICLQAGIALAIALIAYNILLPTNSSAKTIQGTALQTVLLHPSQEARSIVSLLILIFTYTIISTIFKRVEINKEQNSFNKLRENLPNTTSLNNTEDILRKALADTERDSLLVQATQAVWDARHLDSPDLEAINATLDALEDKRSGSGSGVSNRLMLLSLLGTILGLAQVISTLEPQIKSASATGDVQAIFDNLQGTLTQMGTAFSSTAWGILLSTLLSWITSVASASRQKYAAEVQYFAVSELAPRVFSTSPGAAVDGLKVAILQGQQLIKDTESAIKRSTNEQSQYLQRLEAAHKSIENETKSLITKVESVFINNATQFAQNLTKVGNYVVNGAAAQIDAAKQLDALLIKSTEELSDAADSLRSAAIVVQGLDNTVTKIDATAKQMNADLGNIAPKLQSLLTAQSDALAKASQVQANTLTNLGQTQAQAWGDRLSQQESVFKKSLEELQKNTVEIRALVNSVQPRFPSSGELDKLRSTLDGVTKAAETLARGGFSTVGTPPPTGGSSISPAQLKTAMSEALEPLARQLQNNMVSPNTTSDNGIGDEIARMNQQINILAREIHGLVKHLQTLTEENHSHKNVATSQSQDSSVDLDLDKPQSGFWKNFLRRKR